MHRTVEPPIPPSLWSRDFSLICLSNFFVFVNFQLLLPTLPLFVHTVGGPEGTAGWVIGVFTLAAVAIRPWIGRIIDRKGSGKALRWGLLLFFLSTLGYLWIEAVIPLLLLRIAHGLTWGVVTTAAGTVASDLMPPSRRGEGMGVYGLFSNVSLVFGPALGLWVVQTHSFSALFYLAAGLALASFATAKWIPLLSHPIASDSEPAANKPTILAATWLPSAMVLLVFLTLGAAATYVPLFAMERGIPHTGWFFTVYAVAMMLTRIWSGKQFDRGGPQRVIPIGLALIVGSLTALSLTRDPAMLLTAAALYGFGLGSVQPALQAWTIQRTPPGTRGKANSTFFTAIDLGIGLGSILAGILVQQTGYPAMFLAFIIPVVGAALLYAFTNRKKALVSDRADQSSP
ncbi:MFS transporter [Desmospora profundinema]|uniref:MFS family permease n=1 Tax=Desmospora profundinema TaxID=1571184 RepID=A0ABU1IQK1_9BACL|nr:MFS transporter [Desmospora profundinema]MDR6226419.1 MFS family permease [Desmospora profundinema]